MDEKLEQLHQTWINTLHRNLQDPTVARNLELLKDDQRRMIDNFIKSKSLPDEVSGMFVETVQELLSGLYKIPLTLEELKTSLFPDGSPLTPDELKARFNTYLQNKLESREQNKVRFVLE
jgi:hypothetical protein